MLACAAFAALSFTGGCSFTFVDTAVYDNGVLRPGECTTSFVPPVADTVLVATHLASAVFQANQQGVANKNTFIALDLAGAAVWLSSAIYGYYFTTECTNLRAEQGPHYQLRNERTVLSGGPSAPSP